MDSKKIIIFYYSYSTMSTEKLVKGIQASFPNIEILLLPNEEKNDVTSYDYIGFASGISMGLWKTNISKNRKIRRIRR